MDYGTESVINVEYQGRFAIITIDKPKKLNALSRMQYYELAQKLREVATHDEVFVTVLLGKGRFFSAGADVGMPRPEPSPDNPNLHREFLTTIVPFNLNVCQAFSTHPKILVVGMNGPAVGMSAAVIAHADFVYCAPHAFLFTPFSSLGLVAEAGASLAFVQRLGIAKANEALIMSKRIPAQELERCGFVNAILDVKQGEDELFREKLLHEVKERLGDHLVGESLVKTKSLIRKPYEDTMNLQNMAEAFGAMNQYLSGAPQEQFKKIARGEKRHKL